MFTIPNGTTVLVKAKTIDLSLSGVCFERTVCEICTGYEKVTVHKDCIFYKYSIPKMDSESLDLYIYISESEVLNLKGKVVWTLIEKDSEHEFVGIRFANVSHDKREKLRDILKKYAETHA